MLLEAMGAVDDGIVREPADVDTGVTLGLGFPAIRGGLFDWYASQGARTVMVRLSRYQNLGPAFHPSPALARVRNENGPGAAGTSPGI